MSEQRELSFCKAIQWIRRGKRLATAFSEGRLTSLFGRMVSNLKRMLKQKRKRLTTWELIAQQVAYLDSFTDLGCFAREELTHVS